jgi:endoglucanase
VWSINHESVPNAAGNSYAAYYPGDSYVDWTAISGFNFGTTRPTPAWRPFSDVYGPPLAYLKTLKKPICIAEFASVEQGGNKGAWIADAYKRIRAVPQIKAVIYYDALETGGPTTQDWRVGTSAGSLTAFESAIAPGYFVPGPAEALSTWGNSLQGSDWAYLSTLTPIY